MAGGIYLTRLGLKIGRSALYPRVLYDGAVSSAHIPFHVEHAGWIGIYISNGPSGERIDIEAFRLQPFELPCPVIKRSRYVRFLANERSEFGRFQAITAGNYVLKLGQGANTDRPYHLILREVVAFRDKLAAAICIALGINAFLGGGAVLLWLLS